MKTYGAAQVAGGGGPKDNSRAYVRRAIVAGTPVGRTM